MCHVNLPPRFPNVVVSYFICFLFQFSSCSISFLSSVSFFSSSSFLPCFFLTCNNALLLPFNQALLLSLQTFSFFFHFPPSPIQQKNNLHSPTPTTTTVRRNIIDILEERGLLESITSDALRSASSDPIASPLRVYCGFDPTAESLHLGNLLGLIVLSWFRRCGHRTVALIGGATPRVGDPSGKSLERPELDADSLEKNTVSISNTIRRILGRAQNSNFDELHVSGSSSVVILNNYDRWKEFSLLDFLKRVGRYASDQWGNIIAGTELIRKILQVEGAYGLTFPLLLKNDGTKFGKSEDSAIWLSPSFLSPYKFYQYFFSVTDAVVIRFLKILTFLDIQEIVSLEGEMMKPGYVPNTAQRRLAEEVTLFVHGEEGLTEALKATEALRPGSETKLDWKTIEGIAEDVPSRSLAYDEVLNLSLVDLSVSSGLFDSKSAARRLLKQGGLYLNNNRVDSENKRIEAADIVDGKVLLLSAGKKNKVLVRIA